MGREENSTHLGKPRLGSLWVSPGESDRSGQLWRRACRGPSTADRKPSRETSRQSNQAGLQIWSTDSKPAPWQRLRPAQGPSRKRLRAQVPEVRRPCLRLFFMGTQHQWSYAESDIMKVTFSTWDYFWSVHEDRPDTDSSSSWGRSKYWWLTTYHCGRLGQDAEGCHQKKPEQREHDGRNTLRELCP